jgi:protein O-mannosyl-transferase
MKAVNYIYTYNILQSFAYMGKKKAKSKQVIDQVKEESQKNVAIERIWWNDFRIQALVLIIIGLICFANSFKNEYALDDGITIVNNDYVQAGTQGIPDILSNDAYQSFYNRMGSDQELAGGRYRPLSIITFAIEQQFFGAKNGETPPHDIVMVRHVINVLLYILSVILLLYFLRNFICKENTLIAFIASLIFLIHPIHTEVVANIKSRDEILSFLFIILTFIKLLKYAETRKKISLVTSLLFFFLALLSKEYAIVLLALIPMLLYIVKKDTITNSLIKTIPFLLVTAIYMWIRLSIVGIGASSESTEILNSPFLYATAPEKWATKIEILDHYLRLVFYPDPLSCDYSYNTIPYVDFTNGWVWLSILIHVSLIMAAIKLFFKRNILSFAIAFYLFNLLLVSNFVFDIGATMGERLLYHSSFGFALAFAVGAIWVLKKINNTQVAIVAGTTVLTLMVVWSAAKDMQRNAEWKNDVTLFIKDVNTVPNSVLANGNAGKDYIDMALKPENKDRQKVLMDSGIVYLNKAVSVDNKFVNGYINLAFVYVKTQQYDSAAKNIGMARALYYKNPTVDSLARDITGGYTNEAILYINSDLQKGLEFLQKATYVSPNSVDAWNNLGNAYYSYAKDYPKAKEAWNKVLQIDPNNQKAKESLNSLPKGQ